MRKPSIDRRVARTQAALQHALTSLILKKGYEAITVGDICAAANVGRSTFYSHYTSKDDLKQSELVAHLGKLFADRHKTAPATYGDANHAILAFSLGMFEHARDHIDLYRALAGGRGGAVALGTIRRMVSDVVRRELAKTGARHTSDAETPEFIVQYVASAYMAILTWWLDGGAKLPPHRIDAMFRHMVIEGIGRK